MHIQEKYFCFLERGKKSFIKKAIKLDNNERQMTGIYKNFMFLKLGHTVNRKIVWKCL